MGLRPGHCYKSKKDRAYTRLALKVHRKNYIGAAPGLRTRQFNMGNPKKRFSYILDLIVEEAVQIRDNAIESARITINRTLQKKIGKEGYFLRIRIYPYHVLRENKQAQGAHADRIQSGMSHSFGKAIGRAVRVRPGQKIFSVLVDKQNIQIAKDSLLKAKSKIGAALSVRIGTDVKSIGTRPKVIEEIEEEEEKKEEKPEGEKEKEEEAEKEKKEEKEPEKKEGKEEKKQETEKARKEEKKK